MTMRCNVSSWQDKNNVSSNIFQIHSHCQKQLPWNIWNFSAPLLWKYIGKYFSFYAFQRTWRWVHARTKQMETMKNMVTTVDVWKIQAIGCVYQNFYITNLFWKGKPITGVARKKWQTVERVDLSVDVGPFWHLVGDQFDLIAGTEVLNEILITCYFLLFYINLGKIPFCWIVLLIIPCVFARGIIGEADNKD